MRCDLLVVALTAVIASSCSSQRPAPYRRILVVEVATLRGRDDVEYIGRLAGVSCFISPVHPAPSEERALTDLSDQVRLADGDGVIAPVCAPFGSVLGPRRVRGCAGSSGVICEAESFRFTKGKQ